jgi:membrane-bound metal-dependent hydrolase YbcI (DUF457 family)
MDTVTHGIAGALLGRALLEPQEGRAATLAATLGALFPDIDIVFERFTGDPMALLKYHRGITHSFVALPVFAVLVAVASGAWARWRGWPVRRWGILWLAAAIGIASHIVLDGMTSFGTRMWDPVSFERVAWDWLFIVDPLLTALLVVPLVLTWVYSRPELARRRAVLSLMFFSVLAAGVWLAERTVGAGMGAGWLLAIWAALAVVFLPPLRRGTLRTAPVHVWRWGLALATAYVLTCGLVHHAALQRVRSFAAELHASVEDVAAVPLPPSPWTWAGLVRTPQGVWLTRLDVRSRTQPAFRFLPEAGMNRYVALAFEQPRVKTYLGFARFPVIHYYEQGQARVVEFSDARFYIRQPVSRHPFTYRVVLDPDGEVLRQGWARD